MVHTDPSGLTIVLDDPNGTLGLAAKVLKNSSTKFREKWEELDSDKSITVKIKEGSITSNGHSEEGNTRGVFKSKSNKAQNGYILTYSGSCYVTLDPEEGWSLETLAHEISHASDFQDLQDEEHEDMDDPTVSDDVSKWEEQSETDADTFEKGVVDEMSSNDS